MWLVGISANEFFDAIRQPNSFELEVHACARCGVDGRDRAVLIGDVQRAGPGNRNVDRLATRMQGV